MASRLPTPPPAATTPGDKPLSIPSKPLGSDPDRLLYDGKHYKRVTEGIAHILTPDTSADEPSKTEKKKRSGLANDSAQQVFYNPIQQFNRDLSVLAIKAYGEEALEKKRKKSDKVHAALEKRNKRRHEKKAANELEIPTTKNSDLVIEAETETTPSIASNEDAKRKRDDEQEVNEGSPSKVAKTAAADEGTADTPVVVESERKPEAEAEAQVAAPGTHQSQEYQAEKDCAKQDEIQNSEPAAAAAVASEPDPDVSMTDAPAEGSKASEGENKVKTNVPRLKILDALSASGLRALRYAHELPFPVAVTANDMSAAAAESIEKNVQYNGLQDKITVSKADAMGHMYTVIAQELSRRSTFTKSEKYDVIDLDPYGTAANFFDGAVQSVRDDGGLLCVTCTDAGVWASNGYSEKAYSLYGGIPMKGNHSHEAGLRLILHGIATSAARYGLAIEPLLSLSIDFYCRIFVQIRKSPHSVKFHASKTMIAYNCDDGCGAWTTQPLLKNKQLPNKNGDGYYYKHSLAQAPTAEPLCEHCGSKTHLAGPMYAGYMHSPSFIRRILDDLPNVDKDIYKTTDRIHGMLQNALDEVLPPRPKHNGGANGESTEADPAIFDTSDPTLVDPVPFSFRLTTVAGAMKTQCPSEAAFRGALIGLGFRTTRSHCKPNHIKTDAPWAVIWEVLREWVKQKSPVKKESIKKKTPAWRLLRWDEEEAAQKAAEEKQASNENKAAEESKAAEEIEEPGFEKRLNPRIIFNKENEEMGREPVSKKLVRYQMNPREFWGPMQRAKNILKPKKP